MDIAHLRSVLHRRRHLVWVAGAAVILVSGWAFVRFFTEGVVEYEDEVTQFKYGSAGGERASGIPYAIWRALPEVFSDLLPGPGYESLGFIYEPGRDLPVGVSERTIQGVRRVFLNCAVCHAGTVRDAPGSDRRVYVGMPANTIDLQAFQRFLAACVVDERFTGERLVPVIATMGTDDFLNRLALRYVGIPMMRERLLTLRQRFASFMDRAPPYGPGRFDTFNPPKVLLNFRMDLLPEEEWFGVCDFPSVWLQAPRRGLHLHWDGNNTSMEERNRSASFGAGALPTTLDRAAMRRTEKWLLDVPPPPYPYPIDHDLAQQGRATYGRLCANCHGADGRDFSGALVGKVTPIDEIGTDRHRLDSYTHSLAVNQGLLYAGFPDERFRHFRKTNGYANQPLDGLWLRAPYLHNGSVPHLRALLEPAARRPAVFFRGYDVYDQANVGFVSTVASENGRDFFRFDTAERGNGNAGHEGTAYGTDLPAAEKNALLEYLKTF